MEYPRTGELKIEKVENSVFAIMNPSCRKRLKKSKESFRGKNCEEKIQ